MEERPKIMIDGVEYELGEEVDSGFLARVFRVVPTHDREPPAPPTLLGFPVVFDKDMETPEIKLASVRIVP